MKPDQLLNLNCEADRLKTFDSWTTDGVDKCKLAKFGFFFKEPDTTVQCVYCDVMIAEWDRGDDPLREHIYWEPSCSFLLGQATSNIPIEFNFESQLPSPDYFQPIIYNEEDITDGANRPIVRIELSGALAARHPDYSTLADRYKSFEKWPRSLKPSPLTLSEAGLFYLGISDWVKCFYCGLALRDWLAQDEPWTEHARCNPNCSHVIQYKGEEFIEQAKNSLVDELPLTEMVTNDNYNEADDNTVSATRKCNVCLAEELNAVFLPCMHIYSCVKCGFAFTHCPVCRRKIADMKKCFIA